MKITIHKKIAAYFGYEFTRISNSIYQNQTRHTIALIEQHDIDLVIDVGANMGQFSTDLRKSGYAGQIVSFEPLKECYQHLQSITDDKWHVENIALGSEGTTETINISNKSVFSSILETNQFGKSNFSESIKIVGQQTISVKKLDDVINAIVKDLGTKKIFLKLDTQGYDNQVILGATNTLPLVHMLQTEIPCKPIYKDTPPFYDTLKNLCEIGFNITGIFPLSRDKKTMEILEFDCILLRSS